MTEHDADHGDDHRDDHRDRRDDPLREQLAALDPAASLPPVDPAGVSRLLEEIMSDEQLTESRSDHTRRRSPLTWLVAAAAAVVLVGAGVFLVLGGDDEDGPEVAGDTTSRTSTPTESSSAAETVTDLTGGGGINAKCMTPEAAPPEVIQSQTTVFDGVVESISGDLVTLRPSHWYNGEPTDVVVVHAVDDDMQALLSGVDFKEGKRYLVSATDGQVTLCMFTAPYSDALAAVYENAFPS